MYQPDTEPSRPTAPVDMLSLQRAVTAVSRLLAVVGPGEHHIVGSLGLHDVAAAHVEVVLLGPATLISHTPTDVKALATLLGRAFSNPAEVQGGLIVRTKAMGRRSECVRGWHVRDGWLLPLSAFEVFSAYCTDAATGEPLSPEPDVQYNAGLPIPSPEVIF